MFHRKMVVVVAGLGAVLFATAFWTGMKPAPDKTVVLNSTKSDAKVTADKPVSPLSRYPEAPAPSQPDLLQRPDSNPAMATFANRISEITARRNGATQDVDALYSASQKSAAWSAADTVSAAFPLTDEERSDGREFIQIDPLKIESLVVGDTLDIDIGQINGHFTARIDRAEVQGNDNVSWYGHFENMPDGDNAVDVVFTRSATLLTGGITTPSGHFELEARGNEGWIASSATLFKQVDTALAVPPETLAKTPAISKQAAAEKAAIDKSPSIQFASGLKLVTNSTLHEGGMHEEGIPEHAP